MYVVFRTREGQCRNVRPSLGRYGFSFSLGALLGLWLGFAVLLLVVAFFWNQCVPMQRNNLNETSKYLLTFDDLFFT